MNTKSPSIVLKFGGAAVQEASDFKKIAQIIKRRAQNAKILAVVISAMADTTNALIKLAHTVAQSPCQRELDMLVSTGERVSASLLCLSLHNLDIKAKSFTGSQAGIITSNHHSDAKILDVKPFRLIEAHKEGVIPVVAGFQGVSQTKDITTLGRGGSDISAVALAIALNAAYVAFYKDVSMIYSQDPNNIESNTKAKPFTQLNYIQALDVMRPPRWALHPRCIHLAQQYQLPLHFGSFNETDSYPGTIISSQKAARTAAAATKQSPFENPL